MQDQEISKYIIKNIGTLRAETIPQTGVSPEEGDEPDCGIDGCNCSCLFDSSENPKSQPNIQD
jgi:hypothetical protein